MKNLVIVFLFTILVAFGLKLVYAGETHSSITKHVETLEGPNWQAKFRVKLYSEKLNTSSMWVLVINNQGCVIESLSLPEQGAALKLPPIYSVTMETDNEDYRNK